MPAHLLLCVLSRVFAYVAILDLLYISTNLFLLCICWQHGWFIRFVSFCAIAYCYCLIDHMCTGCFILIGLFLQKFRLSLLLLRKAMLCSSIYVITMSLAWISFIARLFILSLLFLCMMLSFLFPFILCFIFRNTWCS